MDVDKEIRELKEGDHRHRNYPLCCCWPVSSAGFKSWGVLLVAIGSIWLLNNLGITATIVWPLFFIGLGIFYLSQAGEKSHL